MVVLSWNMSRLLSRSPRAAQPAKPLRMGEAVASLSRSPRRKGYAGWLQRHYGLVFLSSLAALIPIGVLFQTGLPKSLESLLVRPQAYSLEKEGARRLQEVTSTPTTTTTCAPADFDAKADIFFCPTNLAVQQFELEGLTAAAIKNAAMNSEKLGYPRGEYVVGSIVPYNSTDYKCVTSTPESAPMLRLQLFLMKTDPSQDVSQLATTANDEFVYDADFRVAFLNDVFARSLFQDTAVVNINHFTVTASGWILMFPENLSTGALSAKLQGNDALIMGIAGEGMWPWWAWFLFVLLVGCCLMPLFFFTLRRRMIIEEEEDLKALEKRSRKEEGLEKLYGPEWAVTELDFEDKPGGKEEFDMNAEYNMASKNSAMQSRSSNMHSPVFGSSPKVDAADAAWVQEGGQRSVWRNGTDASPQSPVRRFDIDEDDNMDNMRNLQPHYSFDGSS